VDVVPAWSTSLLKRLVRAPKRYLRDTGLAAAVLDVDTDGVLRNGDILGRMIEHERLDHPAEDVTVAQHAVGVDIEDGGGESGVAQVAFRCPDESLEQAGAPRRHDVD